MKIEELKTYKKILILGYGKEGKATFKFLKAKFPEIKVQVADQTMDKNYLERQKEFDLVIKTPGISRRLVTIPYTTATNIFFANCKNMIIGVTGSKGKSTTSSLIHHFLMTAGLKSNLIGNIGHPALENMLSPITPQDIFVFELSSYQLEDINYSPHISLILNLFPEHLDYHSNLDNYYNSKQNIFSKSTKKDYYIYNPRYTILKNWARKAPCIALPIEENIPIDQSDTPLLGSHNFENIKAALTVGSLIGLNKKNMMNALKSFKPLPHRLQNIGTHKKITFYDDAISTAPESTIAAIEALKNIDTIFLGGLDRGFEFSQLAKTLIKYHIRNIVFFPNSGANILKALKSETYRLPRIFETEKMEEAVKFAYENTAPGFICLLSTASPSYTLWKNFEEKGDQFQFFVKKYRSNNQ